MVDCEYCGRALDEDSESASCPSCRHIEDKEKETRARHSKQLSQLQAENKQQADFLVLAKEQMDAQEAENKRQLEIIGEIAIERDDIKAENKLLKEVMAIAYEAICTGDQEASDKAIGLIEDFEQSPER